MIRMDIQKNFSIVAGDSGVVQITNLPTEGIWTCQFSLVDPKTDEVIEPTLSELVSNSGTVLFYFQPNFTSRAFRWCRRRRVCTFFYQIRIKSSLGEVHTVWPMIGSVRRFTIYQGKRGKNNDC